MKFGVAVVAALFRASVAALRALSLLIEFSEYALYVVREFLGRLDDTVVIFGSKFFFRFFNGVLYGRFIFFGEFVAAVFQGLFDGKDKRIEFVSVLDDFFSLLIFFFVLLGFFNGFVNVFFGKVGRRSNGDVRGFLRAEILSRNVYYAVGVDIEGNFDLRDSSRSGRDAGKIELT